MDREKLLINSAKRIAVIIPSYNESRNIRLLIPGISQILPRATIIVVDDSWEDEQMKIKKACTQVRKSVIFVSRKKKEGRGSAVIDGMKAGLSKTRADIFVEMDADLAHDPKEIPRLYAPIGSYDLVVGSRYMRGGTIVKWTKVRLGQSRIINFFLKLWLGLGLTDYTNGFRAYSRKACKYLVTAPLREKGFIALSETAYALVRNGFRVTEVPISFTDRKYGKSNADIHELLRSLIGVVALRFR